MPLRLNCHSIFQHNNLLLCVHQGTPTERQPVWDYYQLSNLLHSGKTLSDVHVCCLFVCVLLLLFFLLFLELKILLVAMSNKITNLIFSERVHVPICVCNDVFLWMLCCWCVAKTQKVCFCETWPANCYHNDNNILPNSHLGEQLTEAVRVRLGGK